ncbi:MAG: undecaprenyl-diphosphate phosphatase [Burkholderiales bacterium]|nr:undecaprenyl-diphosphate phosphatase [Phycisphaerae bacterium]
MSDYLLAAILGIVEGLTEFLPVSSTAHIRLTQAALKGSDSLKDPFWKLFAVVIQLPAILAVVVYFFRRIVAFVKSFLANPRITHPIVLVMIAFVVTAVPAVLAKKIIKGNLESLYVMGGALLVGGVVMWVIDAIFGRREKQGLAAITGLDQMKPWQAVWIGAVQVLSAIFPGASRSMTTIAAGQVAGLNRTTALEFSFFLSIPIMFAAFAKDMKDSLDPTDADYIGHALTQSEAVLIAIGSVTSFVVALAVIAWFMAWVKKNGFVPFAIYRIIIGIVVLTWAYRGT